MEKTKYNLVNVESNKKLNENKSKILYKFKISDSASNKKNFIGKCFLIDLNLDKNKNISPSKSINKLPSIILKEKNNISDSLTLQKSKSQNKRKNYILKKFKSNKKLSNKQLDSTNLYPPINNKYDSFTLKTEPKNNYINDAFLKRIIDLYYPKFSRIKYLTDLFEDNEKNDLKMIYLKKIKGNIKKSSIKKEKENKFNYHNIHKKNIYKKIISLDDKLNDNEVHPYKLTKAELEKQLKYFHQLKIKICKDKVNETLNDLKKLKSKNMIFIENFRKSCDFKFDDDLFN